MSFLYPYALIGLILPVILGVAGYVLYLRRKGNWEQLVSPAHKKNLVRTTSPLHSVVPTILTLLALACCVIATARPFNGYKNTEATLTGRNLIIALDISRSMETQDVSPSRLEEARTAARVLIDSLPTDKIGLIIFSGESELTIPLTYDHLTLQETINLVNRDWESYGGSNLAEVLKLAMQTFERSEATGSNALVILSDGEDTMDFPPALLEEAKEKNLLLIVVGIGTTEGATIPDAQSETGMWQDENGKHVISKLQPQTLSMMARETGGDFFIMNNSTDLAAFAKAAVEKIDRHEETQSAGKTPNDMFAYFAGAALLLIIPAILLATRWRNMPKNLSSYRSILLLALLCCCGSLNAAPSEESIKAYRQAIAYNAEGKTAECADELSKALLDADSRMQAAALHHLGNLRTENTFSALKKLYESTEGQPKQPSVEELESIIDQLEKDSEYYKNALKQDAALTQASTNLQHVATLVERIKEEIERLKQQQQQEQESQQQQDNQQKQNDQQQQDNQQKQDDQQQQDNQQKQDDQQQQDNQQKQDDQQQQDNQQKQDNQQQQDNQQKQNEQQNQQQQQDNPSQQQDSQNEEARRAQRQMQRAKDRLNMTRDEENEAEARKLRRQFEYRNNRRKPSKDY